MNDMLERGEFDKETAAQIEALGENEMMSDELSAKVDPMVETKLAGMTEEDKRALATKAAEEFVGTMSYTERVKTQLSLWDLLWFGLAIFAAFGILSKESSG
jgi:hypothetical protein